MVPKLLPANFCIESIPVNKENLASSGRTQVLAQPLQLPFIYIPFAILDIHLDIYLDIPLANQTLDDDDGESDGGRVMLLHRYLNGTSRNLIASQLVPLITFSNHSWEVDQEVGIEYSVAFIA